jgi:LuxR family maltose regulon positive regulatory protein
MLPPVLTTKLHMPSLRPTLVPRPRLTHRIDEGLRLGHRLILIAAPAGFGKTTVVSEWQASEVGQVWPLAWVSLDEGDNDPVHFWRYIIRALETVQPGLGSGAYAFLEAPQSPVEHAITVLINALSQLTRHIVLVLDDYHVIQTELIHQGITFLLDHLPSQLHLIMTSRTAPPLPLNRIRVRNQLTELNQNDLRFSPVEATLPQPNYGTGPDGGGRRGVGSAN